MSINQRRGANWIIVSQNQALSKVSNYLELLPSPFYKLNHVKLPQGCKESSISATLRKYLLGSTPGASIVTTMPRNLQNHQAVSVSRTSQKLDEPLETPMKKLIFPDAPKKVCSDTVEKTVKVESVVDAGRLRKAGASVVGIGVDQAVHVSPSFQKVIQDDPFTTLTNELINFQDIHKEVSADAVEKMVKLENVRQAGAAVAGTGIYQASSSRESADIWDWKGHEAVPVSATNQKVMLEEHLATLTKDLAQSQGIHTKVCVDTVGKRMQSEEKMVKVENVRQAGAAVAGTGIDQASSSRESADIWDWKGHEAVPVSATNQKVMLEEPLATLTKELAQSQGIRTKVCVDTVGKRMQSEDLVKNCIVDADRVRLGGTPVAGTCDVPAFKGRNQLL